MNIEDFIKNSFQKIQRAFPNARLEYQYNYYSNTHFVKVSPLEVYKAEAFIDLDLELTERFDDLNPTENLCFISEGALVELDNPSIILEPKKKPAHKFNFEFTTSDLPIQPSFLDMAVHIAMDVLDTKRHKNTFSFKSIQSEPISILEGYKLELDTETNIIESQEGSSDLETLNMSNVWVGNSKFAMAA